MNRSILTIIIIGSLSFLLASKDDVAIPEKINTITAKANGTESSDMLSIPLMLNYQGKLTDAAGYSVSDSTYSITFRLFTEPSGGSAYWTETQSVSTHSGLYNVLLGGMTAIPNIPSDGNCYLEMQVNPNSPMTPRIRLVSTAYAYISRKADSANYATSAPLVRPITPPIYSDEIRDTTINSEQIKDGAIENAKLTANAVTTDKIQNGTITRQDVTSNFKAPFSDTADYARLAPAADSTRIAGNSHKLQGKDTSALDTRYVNEGQINSVASVMVQDSAVTMIKINRSGAGIGNVIKWTNIGWAPSIDSAGGAPVGPAGGDLTGTYPNPSIANNAVTNAKLADGSVTNTKIAPGITDTKITGTGSLISNFNADLLDGQHSSYFLTPANDYGRQGVATDLYENNSTLTNLYINEGQTAGGNLTGTYPNPTIANNVINSNKIIDGTVSGADLAKPCSLWASVSSPNAVLSIKNTTNGNGIIIDSAGGSGIRVNRAGDYGIWLNRANTGGLVVDSCGGNGFEVNRASTYGVHVTRANINGVHIDSAGNYGVYATGTTGGVYGGSAAGTGVRAYSGSGNALAVQGTSSFSGQITSTLTTGTAPINVNSNTVCPNLNADLLDGLHSSNFSTTSTDFGRSGVATDLYEGTSSLSSKYAAISHNHDASYINDGTGEVNATNDFNFPSSTFISNLDADYLDGQHGAYYRNASNINAGTLGETYLSSNVTLLNNAQTVSGLKTFNPSTGIIPFAVDATKNGVVANLNADMLDGQQAAGFATATHSHDVTYVNEGQLSSISSTMIQDAAVTMSKLDQAGAAVGQTIKWTGTIWAPRNDSVNSPPTGPAGGDLTGTYPNPTIASNTITTVKIADGNVTDAKIASGISDTKISGTGNLVASLNADMLDGQHAAGFAGSTHNHDATYVNEAQVNSISTSMLQNSAVTNLKLGSDAVTADKILDGTILAADLSFTPAARPISPGVATNEIADSAVTSVKIVDNSISGMDIAKPCTLNAGIAYPGVVLRVRNTGNGNGITVDSAGWSGLLVRKAGYYGVQVDSANEGLYVNHAVDNGIYINNAVNNGVYINNAGLAGVSISNSNSVGIIAYSNSVGGKFIADKDSAEGLYAYSYSADPNDTAIVAYGKGFATGGWSLGLDGGEGLSIVSPKQNIITAGTATIRDGECDITFDKIFSENLAPVTAVKIIITPSDIPAGLVSVTEKSHNGFKAKLLPLQELSKFKTNPSFDWLAIGELKKREITPDVKAQWDKLMQEREAGRKGDRD
jgi:hypothetical protein